MKRLLLIATMLIPSGCEPEDPALYKPPAPIVRPTPLPMLPPRKRPSSPPERRVSDEDARALLSRITALCLIPHGEASECGEGETGLSQDVRTYRLELRLFSRAYPEIAKSAALDILEDGDADVWHLSLALDLLGKNHQTANARLEAAIANLADHPEKMISGRAIALLGWSGRLSRFRYPLWSYCAKGSRAAFDALSRDELPDTVEFLRDLLKTGRFPALCKETLERITILRSPNCESSLEEMIRNERTSDHYWARWVAWERYRPLLRRILGELIEDSRNKIQKALNTDPPFDPDFPSIRPLSYRIVRSTSLPEAGRDVDELLIEFAELGGELAPFERERLYYFGFLGNPEERLLDIALRRIPWRFMLQSLRQFGVAADVK